MRPLITTLLLLSVVLSGLACEKNVREVRRDRTLMPEAPAGQARTANQRTTPEAPAGTPVGLPPAESLRH